MVKKFMYRNIDFEVRITDDRKVEVTGISGKYAGITATSEDTEIFDYCDCPIPTESRRARWKAYILLRDTQYRNF